MNNEREATDDRNHLTVGRLARELQEITFRHGNALKHALRADAKPGSPHGEDTAKAARYATRYTTNVAKVTSIKDGLRSLREREDDTDAYPASRQEDTTKMREYLQDRLAAIYAQVKKEVPQAWDAT